MEEFLNVEVCQKISSTLLREDVEEMIDKEMEFLLHLHKSKITEFESTELTKHIDSIVFSTNDETTPWTQVEKYKVFKYFVYRLSQEESAMATMQHDSEDLNVAAHTILPAMEYDGLWESLYYDTNVKDNLLHFVETTMMFSDRKVNHNIISWNKVILLHGPPGTGKTSLCKAIAHKAAIRLGKRYAYAELVEINSHSLFSKWFSESGKLVMKLFEEIRRLLDNPEALICVLIDEVESLAHARKSCANGTEPSDAIRVVNALLTQLDQIKRYPNVLILTTSNVTEAIDLAFVDRADVKQYIGHPQTNAIYAIYKSCLEELIRTKFIQPLDIPPSEFEETTDTCPETIKILKTLMLLCRFSIGLSGRALRKIPFLTHSMYVQTDKSISFYSFLEAMKKTVGKYKADDSLSK